MKRFLLPVVILASCLMLVAEDNKSKREGSLLVAELDAITARGRMMEESTTLRPGMPPMSSKTLNQTGAPEDSDVFYVLTRRSSIPEYGTTERRIWVINTDGTIVHGK